MSYRLEPTEPLPSGLVRTAGELLHRAATELADPTRPAATAVHEARKAFKRVRSLLRLGRPALGERRFVLENTAVRDLGRSISGFRDADALLETFEKMEEKGRFPEALAVDHLHDRLTERRDEHARAQSGALTTARHEALRTLAEVQGRLGQWQPPVDCARAFAKALKQAFRKATKAMATAADEPTNEALHEWRKQVKHCWYMAELLAHVWPGLGAAAVDDLEALADWLGEDHDLVMLEDFVRLEPKPWAPEFDVAVFHAAVAARRHKLQKKAFALGAKVFADRPQRVRKTLAEAWQASATLAEGAAAPLLVQLNGR